MTARLTLVDAALAPSLRRMATCDLALIASGAALTAAAAQISVRLPFTPVPLTGQTFTILLLGAILGARRGAASAVLYVLAGGVGLPVFARASGGIEALVGYTGGYLMAFPLAAALTGALTERGWDRRPWGAAAAVLAGGVTILALGAAWLSHFVGGPVAAFRDGVQPFLIGEALKALLAAALLPAAWRCVSEPTPVPKADA